MKSITFIISLIFLAFFSSQSLLANEISAKDITENDFIIGDENAPITIIEYASMSCSHCADFHKNTLPDVKTEFIDTGKVRMVFRDYPSFSRTNDSRYFSCCIHGNNFFDSLYLSFLSAKKQE